MKENVKEEEIIKSNLEEETQGKPEVQKSKRSITFKGNSRQEPGLVTMKLHQKIHTYTCFNLPVKVYF